MNKFFDSALRALQDAVASQYDGNVTKAAQAWGMSIPTLHNWLKGNRKPSLTKLSPVLNLIGAEITLPASDISRDVCFVDAKMVSAEDGTPPPQAEDYVAAPLVGEVGAGPGYLPSDEIKSWFLVYKRLEAIRYRKNLIAVEIGKTSTSMQPTLNPGDIVLVDRDDRDVARPGHMMLVLDPLDGSGMVKRVSATENGDDFRITFYSDNAAKWEPMVYSLKKDFDDDWDKAIVGRVIWAWSDVREK